MARLLQQASSVAPLLAAAPPASSYCLLPVVASSISSKAANSVTGTPSAANFQQRLPCNLSGNFFGNSFSSEPLQRQLRRR